MMPAVILAAGSGSRLGAQSSPRPKCLTWLGGARLFDHQRRALRACGITRCTVVAGYAARCLRRAHDGPLVVNPDWANCGPVGSLICIPRDQLREGFVLVYGDCVFHSDHLRALLDDPRPLLMTSDDQWHALWSLRMRRVLDDAERLCRDGDRVLQIGGRARSVEQIQGQFTGLLKVAPDAWRAIEAVLDTMDPQLARKLDTTALLSLLISRGHAVHLVPVRGRWLEVDTRRDLVRYRERLRRRLPWSHDWRQP